MKLWKERGRPRKPKIWIGSVSTLTWWQQWNLWSQLRKTMVFTAGLGWWFWYLVVLEDGESGGELGWRDKKFKLLHLWTSASLPLCLTMEMSFQEHSRSYFCSWAPMYSQPLFFIQFFFKLCRWRFAENCFHLSLDGTVWTVSVHLLTVWHVTVIS